MKDYTPQDRWAIAAKLDQILGADLMPDEEDAIEQAIKIICPEFAQAVEDEIQEAAHWYENTSEEEKAAFVAEMEKKYPGPSPDRSGTPAVPPTFNGKILRFGEEKKE